ncbi:MAG: flagellar assembly protein T N-terminal domain-containing protein [Shewanella sp.]
MKTKSLLLLSLLCISISFDATAARWVNATGQASIQNDNIDAARQEAIKQAITYAGLSQGFTMQSQTTVDQGHIINNQWNMAQQLQTQSMKMISELIIGDELQVNIALLVQDEAVYEEQCTPASLTAAILVPQATIKDRSQLNYGQLVNFETELANRLAKQMEAYSHKSFAQLHSSDRLDIDTSLGQTRGYRLPDWLGKTTDSQYILQLNIEDMSLLPATESMFGLMANDPLRHFAVAFSLIHSISGEVIWQKLFSHQAAWPFEKQQQVLPNSLVFWKSRYGQGIDALLIDAIKDLDNELVCRPTLGQIVAMEGNRLVINLGRRHGMNLQDTVEIILKRDITDRLSGMRSLATPSQLTFRLDQVSELSASGVFEEALGTGGIQVQDVVVKQ